MKILTFDTSTDKMYVTLGEDDRIELSEKIENTAQRYNSALLIPVIVKFLKKKNLTMQDINAIGVNTGPGSFTGIRVSATIARIMAQNLDIPAVGISSLEIFSALNNSAKNALVLADARKGKVYTGIYSPEGKIIMTPSALEYEKVIEYIENNDFCVIADNILSEKLRLSGFECINLQNTDYNFGNYLAKLTYKYLLSENKEQFKWFNLKPLYIQPPPITMPKLLK